MDISKAHCFNCGKRMEITRVVCNECDIRVEAQFELSSLAKLSTEDQQFIIAFIHNHGSIKQVGLSLGISYPTVKGRLNAISQQLRSDELQSPKEIKPANTNLLEQIHVGNTTIKELLESLEK